MQDRFSAFLAHQFALSIFISPVDLLILAIVQAIGS
jgi:hypothetical protein